MRTTPIYRLRSSARSPSCRREQAVDAVFGYMEIIDEGGKAFSVYRCGPFSWLRYLYFGSYIPTPTIIFRRGRLDRAPELDERFVDAADYDFYLRLLRGAKVRRLRTPVVRFRYHARSKTASRPGLQSSEGMAIRLSLARNPMERGMIRVFGRARGIRDRLFPPWPDLDRQEMHAGPRPGR